MHSHLRLPRLALTLGMLVVATAPAGADVPSASQSFQYGDTAGYDGSYSYVRTLEGAATLIQVDGDRDALQVNQPVLVGDRIWVSPSGRVEVVLSDRNVLRIDGGSEVAFEALAGSPDRQDRNTVLRLSQGNLQLLVVESFLGEGVPRVDTPNATVYPRDLGSYRITAGSTDWSEVVARDGSAEVVTREGSVLVRAGEEAVIEGDYRTRHQVRSASRLDALELWGQRLDREARYASSAHLDDSLRYEAASLDRYGTWVQVDSRYAWRPRVGVEWRPYYDGRWRFTDLGLTWVSYEPWGWVPYHYGSWDYVPGHGWVWFPGYRFAPAWVYWYWTDHYAGWVPVGYYTRHYRPHFGLHVGFRFGLYGWAGGHWSDYDRWTFCSNRYIGYRDQNRYVRPGERFGTEHRYAVPKRGLVTTDTRGLSRAAVRRSQGIEAALAARRDGDLPDVTDFVARRRDLSEDVRGRILVDADGGRGASASRDRAQILAVDGIPGSAAPARGREPVARGDGPRGESPGLPERAAIGRDDVSRGDRAPSRAAIGRKPAEAPESPTAVRPDRGRAAGSPEVLRPAETPRRIESRPAPAPADDWRSRGGETSRPAARTPDRIETRPAPAPVDDWRSRGAETSRPAVRTPDRIETRPAPAPTDDWRSRGGDVRRPTASAPGRVEPSTTRRLPERPEVQRIEPDSSDWRQRNRSSDRYSIPRRVIEGVRSNGQGSTPFQPDPRGDRPDRIESRPAPVRPTSPPARIESRPSPSRPSSPPPRIESRPSSSQPSSPPPRIQSRPSPSRPSSPPARVQSRPSSPPSRATASRSSSGSSSSRSQARRKPPGE